MHAQPSSDIHAHAPPLACTERGAPLSCPLAVQEKLEEYKKQVEDLSQRVDTLTSEKAALENRSAPPAPSHALIWF